MVVEEDLLQLRGAVGAVFDGLHQRLGQAVGLVEVDHREVVGVGLDPAAEGVGERGGQEDISAAAGAGSDLQPLMPGMWISSSSRSGRTRAIAVTSNRDERSNEADEGFANFNIRFFDCDRTVSFKFFLKVRRNGKFDFPRRS